MGDVTINIVRDVDIYRAGQLPTRGVEAEFMVGKLGPFSVRVDKSDTWDRDLHTRIEQEATRVRSFQM